MRGGDKKRKDRNGREKGETGEKRKYMTMKGEQKTEEVKR
jgi:hypothetical protein